MPTELIQQDLTKLLGLDAMVPEERAIFLANIGELILESALLRLSTELTHEQAVALDYYLETNPSPEMIIDYLQKHHSKFETYLEMEAQAFREEAIAVLGRSALMEVRTPAMTQ
jgi:hypothetical protein